MRSRETHQDPPHGVDELEHGLGALHLGMGSCDECMSERLEGWGHVSRQVRAVRFARVKHEIYEHPQQLGDRCQPLVVRAVNS